MIDLNAGITFCGSWNPDDCAFTRDGAPIVWMCGFHGLVAELRELRALAERAVNGWAEADDLLRQDGERFSIEPAPGIAEIRAALGGA